MAHATEATEVYNPGEPSLNRISLLLCSTAVMARSYHTAERILIYVAILALTAPAVISQTVVEPPANPFLDPKDDPYNPLKYIPSNSLTAIAFGKLRPLKA